MSVKVGVRVRPFNQREQSLNSKLCVEMIGNMTRVFDADQKEKHRDFTFDYSFWSHDQFFVDQAGYFKAEDHKYADQQLVFESVGIQILNNAWDGYHCCLFAYGQTGAGKSYSMVGYGANKGIVPISCEEIFNRIAKNDNPNKQYEVMVSMMEIYNEKVQDLLIPIAKRPKEGHKIREHKTLGIYVEGMSKHYVDTYDLIEKKMEEGGRNRSIAATEMNASSSRAHTIISIEFKQTQIGENNKKREKLSVIHLVDLAGSQKVGKTGATGDRLKEAAGINKSLSVLGQVISALAEKSSGKGKGVVVPYRDSCLTRILQNALGGNSKTLMICAISPATDNFQQTMSTLRYADQAKKIQNKAVVNQSETDKLIRTLTTEREELKEKLLKMQEMFKKFSITPELLEQRNEAEAQLKFLAEKNNDYSTTRIEKKKIEEDNEEENYQKIDVKRPHLANLNQDPQLSRKVKYTIDKEQTQVGKRGVSPPNDIEIGGMGIRRIHAVIKKVGDEFHLVPVEGGEDSGCYLNGNIVSNEQKVFHFDRVSFGTNNIFLILIPEGEPREEIDQKLIDWDFAQNELYLKKQSLEKEINEEKQRKLKEETNLILQQKEEELKELQKNLRESQQLRKQIQMQKQEEKADLQKKIREDQVKIALKQKEIQSKKRKMVDSQTQQKQKTKQKYYFERKLLKTLPKCIELNLIAKQFKKSISMSVKMMLQNQEEDEEQFEMKKRTILIKVVNREVGYSYWWDVDTLSNRYYIIKDLSEQYFQTGVIPQLDQTNDPFWDPQQPTLIGRGFLTTKALAYMFDNPATLPIIGEDEHCGELIVNLVPTDQSGSRNLCEQMDQQEIQFEPEQLIDKSLYYLIVIKSAKIPINYKDIYVQYAVKVDQFEREKYKTNIITEKTNHPVFAYQKLHKFEKVTEALLKFLTTAKITFKVYGCEIIQEEKKTKALKLTEQSGLTMPDVQKAKREDLQKLQKNPFESSDPTSLSSSPKQQQKGITASKSPAVQKKSEPTTKKPQVVYKTPGAVTNNKIGERNQKNQKEKDCEIY